MGGGRKGKFAATQKMEYAIAQTLFPQKLKIESVSTVPLWQQELDILSISENPAGMQYPEPAQIFSIILSHSIWPSFPHHRYLCVTENN